MRRAAVEIYSDYTCPWCYIGWARLEALRRHVAGDVALDAIWHPFEIHPEVPAGGMPVEALAYPPDRWRAMTESLRLQAEEEGIEVGNRPHVANTHRALAAAAWAQAERPDRFADFHERLFRAYFTEGRDLGDPSVLRDVAGDAALDAAGMDDALDEGRYEETIRETSERARRLGITGTPTFVFEGRYAAVGAQPTEALRRVLERALSSRKPEASGDRA